jgi:DNA primase
MDSPHQFNSKEIPKEIAKTCKPWKKYTDTHTVQQIDSGLRLMATKD